MYYGTHDCFACLWNVISNSFDIDFIHGTSMVDLLRWNAFKCEGWVTALVMVKLTCCHYIGAIFVSNLFFQKETSCNGLINIERVSSQIFSRFLLVIDNDVPCSICRIMHELPWITSRVRWFANDFHKWRSNEWNSLANHITNDQKIRYLR